VLAFPGRLRDDSFSHWRLLALTISAIGIAQVPASRDGPINIRVQSDLAPIGAIVTDSRGSPVADLDASRFHLFDDGKEQVIRSCSSEDVPVSIGLLLDKSGSMGRKLSLMKEAAIQFVHAANPCDEYSSNSRDVLRWCCPLPDHAKESSGFPFRLRPLSRNTEPVLCRGLLVSD
jgi:hypothetical protein